MRWISIDFANHARWDLRGIDLVDPHTGSPLCPLCPLDKARNADSARRRIEQESDDHAGDTPPAAPTPAAGTPPLLRTLIEEYAATRQPPAYLPEPDPEDTP